MLLKEKLEIICDIVAYESLRTPIKQYIKTYSLRSKLKKKRDWK